MGAGAQAVTNGNTLIAAVANLGEEIGLWVSTGVKAGNTIWGTQRKIDVVLTKVDASNNVVKRIGIDTTFQDGPGTAKYKVLAKMEDTKHWPITGLIVYAGPGFGDKVEAVMDYIGSVKFDDLRQWLKLYFDFTNIED